MYPDGFNRTIVGWKIVGSTPVDGMFLYAGVLYYIENVATGVAPTVKPGNGNCPYKGNMVAGAAATIKMLIF